MQNTSRVAISIPRGPPVIDVDQVYMKYEYNSDEDGIESIDANTFRQSVRRSAGREKEKDKMRRSATVGTGTGSATPSTQQAPRLRGDSSTKFGPPVGHPATNQSTGRVTQRHVASSNSNVNSSVNVAGPSQPRIGPPPRVSNGINRPSELGAVIQQQQKRTISQTPQPMEVSATQKRRKTEAPLPAHNSWDEPIAGPSRLVHATPTTATTSNAPAMLPIPRPTNFNSKASMRDKQLAIPVTKRHHEVIELSSDGEEVIELLTPKNKKIKRSDSPVRSYSPIEIVSSDEEMVDAFNFDFPPEPVHAPEPEPEPEPQLSDDDGWDWDTIGDVRNSERWNSDFSYPEREEEDDVDIDIEQLSINGPARQASPPTRYIHPNTSKWSALPPPKPRTDSPRTYSPEFIWDKLRTAPNLHFRPRIRHAMMMPTYNRPWNPDFHMHSLKCEHSFKKAPGCINRIEQSGEWTVIGSASIGGLPDDANAVDDGSSAYNRPGSLMTWCNGLDIPKGHTRSKKLDDSANETVKYYAVHDVKFDPHSVAFASTGADRKLRIWTLADDPSEADEQTPAPRNDMLEAQGKSRWKNSDTKTYKGSIPYEIAFNPEASMLAVAEKKVNIYKITERGEDGHHFRLHNAKEPHVIGAMAWGVGPTTNQLFVSSEPDPTALFETPCFEGVHKVYSAVKERFLYELDAKEAGDTLAVNTTGDVLALSTYGAEDKHILRLYDIKRQRRKATAAIQLERFPERYENYEGEVNCAAFSPDGIYLAMARNDNHVHVYDVRMLHQGLIFDYEHFGESKAASQESLYGVVKVHWMHSAQTGRMALVSGGEDGCVRLWNPLHSAENEDNGKPVARMNSDIGNFSVGDRFEGEHQLVVGDCAGEVMIFNDVI